VDEHGHEVVEVSRGEQIGGDALDSSSTCSCDRSGKSRKRSASTCANLLRVFAVASIALI
jgi:hypothetical protein